MPQSKDDFARVGLDVLHVESFILGQGHAHDTARAELHDEVEARRALEGVLQANDELVLSGAKHVFLCVCVLQEVVLEHLLFLHHFHGVEGLIRVAFTRHQEHRTVVSLAFLLNQLKVS